MDKFTVMDTRMTDLDTYFEQVRVAVLETRDKVAENIITLTALSIKYNQTDFPMKSLEQVKVLNDVLKTNTALYEDMVMYPFFNLFINFLVSLKLIVGCFSEAALKCIFFERSS